jgi:UDP-glucose 4-epimerase
MKTILVLGGFGFIGSNFLHYIDKNKINDYNVIVFAKNTNNPFGVKFNCVSKVYKGDFSNKQDLSIIFEENRIDEVFHFLNTTVPATSSNIRFDIESNLLGAIGLLELVEAYAIKKFIFISSGGAIYNNTKLKSIETIDAFPLSSYGIVKLAIEKYIYMFCVKNDISYLILRLSNPYGKFHHSENQGIINVALKKAHKNEPITIWGDGTNKKDYIFIDDFIEILVNLLHLNIEREIINIGSGQLHSINEIVSKIQSLGILITPVYADKKDFDNFNFQINIEKLKKYIGDYNFTSLDAGIQKTSKWLSDNNSGFTNSK